MIDLPFGRETVGRLIPQRPPILMVDAVSSFAREPRPRLVAYKQIDAAEPVFAGHFPSHPIWPGCYTIEGLAQACHLLAVLCRLDTPPASAMGLLGAVEVRFVEPVRPGCRLEYHVSESRRDGAITRYQADAIAAGAVVARGSLTLVERP